MRIENDVKLDFKDVLIRPKRSTLNSRSEVSLERSLRTPHAHSVIDGIPLVAANMDTTGTFEMARVLARHKCFTAVHKHYSVDDWREFMSTGGDVCIPHIAVTTGIMADQVAMAGEILEVSGGRMLCMDVANGYSEAFVEAVRRVRESHPHVALIAGNVVTGEMTEELILSGADAVKVGIGPGSVCVTRWQTGVGYPQLSAIIECADAAHGLSGLIMADGGCSSPGDVAKAFAAGADFVMIGGMLAGHEESGGELRYREDGSVVKAFYGMSSHTAMKKYAGGVADYRSSEGRSVKVAFRGPVEATVLDILGGIRSACTYVGAKHLKELSKRTTFLRVTQQLSSMFGGADSVAADVGQKR